MKVLYNNKVLSAKEREQYRIKADDTIQCLSESIDGFYEILQELKPSQNKEYDKIMSTVLDIELFAYYAHCDCVVMLKYFILSTSPYEKSFFRGKLKVLLNEGFKKLYGFNDNQYKQSYFNKLGKIIHIFPGLNVEYESIRSDLDWMSKQSNWWRNERNIEVHIDMSQLCKIRHEEINESKEAIESLQLLNLFNRVNRLIANLNQVYINYMRERLKIE